MKLYLLRRAAAGKTGEGMEIRAALVMGRAAEYRVDSQAVSKHHARLTPTAEGVLLEDIGSTNGTFLYGRDGSLRRISSPVLLHGGSRFALGGRDDVFEIVSQRHAEAGMGALFWGVLGSLVGMMLSYYLQPYMVTDGMGFWHYQYALLPWLVVQIFMLPKTLLHIASIAGSCEAELDMWTITHNLLPVIAGWIAGALVFVICAYALRRAIRRNRSKR